VLRLSGGHGARGAHDELLPEWFPSLVLPQIHNKFLRIYLERAPAVWTNLPDAGQFVRAPVTGCGACSNRRRARSGFRISHRSGG
jgi:hypothetical protein